MCINCTQITLKRVLRGYLHSYYLLVFIFWAYMWQIDLKYYLPNFFQNRYTCV